MTEQTPLLQHRPRPHSMHLAGTPQKEADGAEQPPRPQEPPNAPDRNDRARGERSLPVPDLPRGSEINMLIIKYPSRA